MEDKEAEKTSQMRRIFVGGLGESVTAEDLQRLFGSLGVVQGLDIVRSKSRSFAYVDFSPSSLKSLSKLFSTVRKQKHYQSFSFLFIITRRKLVFYVGGVGTSCLLFDDTELY